MQKREESNGLTSKMNPASRLSVLFAPTKGMTCVSGDAGVPGV